MAQIMSEVPEFAAFSRFREFNIKNLLYLQAELDLLQQHLILHEEESTLSLKSYQHLIENADSCYHHSMMKSRSLLQEYNDALLRFTKICALPDPDALNMSSLRSWLRSDDGGNYGICDKFGPDKTWGSLRRRDASKSLRAQCLQVFVALVWPKEIPTSDDDLVVTMPNTKIDGLTKWVAYHLMPLWWEVTDAWNQKRKGNAGTADAEKTQDTSQTAAESATTQRKSKAFGTLESISEHAALRFTSALTTVIACLMPVVAIAVLNQVSGTRDLLLCITGFAVMFAVLLIFLTQGTSSRTDIFAATAAFSAVLVVFISQPVIDVQVPPGTQAPVINV